MFQPRKMIDQKFDETTDERQFFIPGRPVLVPMTEQLELEKDALNEKADLFLSFRKAMGLSVSSEPDRLDAMTAISDRRRSCR